MILKKERKKERERERERGGERERERGEGRKSKNFYIDGKVFKRKKFLRKTVSSNFA